MGCVLQGVGRIIIIYGCACRRDRQAEVLLSAFQPGSELLALHVAPKLSQGYKHAAISVDKGRPDRMQVQQDSVSHGQNGSFLGGQGR